MFIRHISIRRGGYSVFIPRIWLCVGSESHCSVLQAQYNNNNNYGVV